MLLKLFSSSVLAFQIFIAYSFGKEFVIYRNRSLVNNQDWDSRDFFKIPTSMCNKSNQRNICGPFGATTDGGKTCSCSCDPDRATFLFHEGQWTCLDNTHVRDLEGDCSNTHFFLSEAEQHLPGPLDFELKALNVGDITPTNIAHGPDIHRCEVYPNTSWYLGCNGMRLGSSLYLDKMKELFTFTVGNTSSAGQYFDLKVKSDVQNTQLLQGGIIGLGIQCNESSGRKYYGCIMFKLIGQLTCPAQVQITSTVMPTVTGTPTPMTKILQNSIATRAIADTSQTTLISQHIRTRSIASSTQSTTVFPSIIRVRLSPDSGRDTNSNSSSLVLITGMTVSILLFVLIVGLIFYGRHYSNKISDASNSRTEDTDEQDTVVMTTQTNLSTQQDAEKMYKALNIRANKQQFYTSNYCVPQSLSTRDNPGIFHLYDTIHDPEGYSTEDNQGSIYSVIEEHKLNSETELEHPAGYNILEAEHFVEEVPKQPVNYIGSKPMYNVLQESYLEDRESSDDCCSISSETQVTAEKPERPLEPVYTHNVLLPYLKNTKSRTDYGAIYSGEQATEIGLEAPASNDREPTVSNVLEELYHGDAKNTDGDSVSSSGSEESRGNGIEAVHNVLEGAYLEYAKSPVDYGTISPERKITLEGPDCHILEKPYLENDDSPGEYSAISSESQTTAEGPGRPDGDVSEPVYHVLEEPCLENSEIYVNCGAISSEKQTKVGGTEGANSNCTEPIINILKEPFLNPESNGYYCDNSSETRVTMEGLEGPPCNRAEPVYNILNKPTLDETESPGNYSTISSREQATVEQPVNHVTAPFYNVLEEPYPEEEEGSQHVVVIFLEGPICNRNVFRKIL